MWSCMVHIIYYSKKLCHFSDHIDLDCRENCEKILKCGHKCDKICGLKCGDCKILIMKKLPCGHK